MTKLPIFLTSIALAASLTSNGYAQDSVKVSPWGKLPTGEEVSLYTLTNDNGMVVTVSSYGALITSILVPDRDGKLADVVLGFDTLDGYLAGSPYFGAVVGRYGNRIAGGQFTIDGKVYKVTQNEKDSTCLHGGKVGFDKKIWVVEPGENEHATWLRLTTVSLDGEEGFPGKVDVVVSYILPKKHDSLIILYGARTDKATPINLTQHTYFNLKGAGEGDILDQVLTINADAFTPVDEMLIPTGELRSVEGTPFDFRKPTPVGERIDGDYEQLVIGGGYDHNWVLNQATAEGEKIPTAAVIQDPKSGRRLEVLTTEPGVQFYAGNFLKGDLKGKGGKVYPRRGGMCLETQHFPNSPNTPEFPTTILNPGEEYQTATVFRFSVDKLERGRRVFGVRRFFRRFFNGRKWVDVWRWESIFTAMRREQ